MNKTGHFNFSIGMTNMQDHRSLKDLYKLPMLKMCLLLLFFCAFFLSLSVRAFGEEARMNTIGHKNMAREAILIYSHTHIRIHEHITNICICIYICRLLWAHFKVALGVLTDKQGVEIYFFKCETNGRKANVENKNAESIYICTKANHLNAANEYQHCIA